MRRPRPLALVAFAQALAILVVDSRPEWAPRPALAVALSLAWSLALAVVAHCARRSGAARARALRAFAPPLAFAFACALACASAHGAALAAARADAFRLPREPSLVEACVAARRARASGDVYELSGLRAFGASPAALPAHAIWNAEPERAPLAVGQCLRMHARLAPLRFRANPGSRSPERRFERAGIAARVAATNARLARPLAGAPSAFSFLAARRERAAEALVARGDGGALIAALALGDTRGIARADRNAFDALGVAHALAVSGLHLALVAGLAFALASAGVRAVALPIDRRAPAVAFAVAAGACYAIATGPGVAAARALAMLAVAAAGFGFRRPGGARSGYWLAAVATLAANPAALFELGPQLSFAATGALLYARRDAGRARPSGVCERLAAAVRESIGVSAVAIAATAPWLALAGLRGSLVGLAANVVAIPWLAFALLPASLASGALALAAPAVVEGASAGSTPTGALDRFARATLAASDGLARASLSVARSGAEALARVAPAVGASAPPAACGIALAVAIAAVGARARRVRTRVFAAMLATTALELAPRADAPAPGALAAFLDVGSGDSIVLRSRDGTAVLIDGGIAQAAGGSRGVEIDLGRTVVLPALDALGVRALALVVATHADADHAGGLAAVVRAREVRELWIPRGARGDPGLAVLLEAARERRVAVREVASDGAAARERVLAEDLAIELLAPARAARPRDRNEASIVLRARVGSLRVLLTGDLGRAGEDRLRASDAPLAADVLKLGHHGSAGSSSSEFLRAVAPALAVVSAACDRAGLPSPRALARVRANDAAIAWTGRDGAIVVRGDPLRVEPFRVAARAPPCRAR